MTDVEVLQRELECVKRQQCDRDCSHCDLVMEEQDIIRALTHAINVLTLDV